MRDTCTAGGDSEFLLRYLTSWLTLPHSRCRPVDGPPGQGDSGGAYGRRSLRKKRRKCRSGDSQSSRGLNSLYRVIALRNQALADLNRDLETLVGERTWRRFPRRTSVSRQEAGRTGVCPVAVETDPDALAGFGKATQSRYPPLHEPGPRSSKAIRVPTWSSMPTTTVTHWNRACAAVTGVPASEMIGTRRQWAAFMPPSDLSSRT